MHVFTTPNPHQLDAIQCKFLTGGRNSKFSFSLTGYPNKVKEHSPPYYFTHSWRENNWIRTFQRSVKYKQTHVGFELGSLCPFPPTISITPQAPPLYV